MHGEDVTNKNHPVIREQYNKESSLSIKYPKFTTKGALSAILEEIIERAGLRARIHRTEKAKANYKKDVSLSNGFRKRFNTILNKAGVNPLMKELLMGHHIGLDDNYLRPQEQDIESEYRKAINALTINEEYRLKQKVTELEVKQDELALMRLEHEKEMKEVRKQMDKIVSLIQENPKLAKVKTEVLGEI